ncbi:hypothetical protein HNQ09_001876 [Deinococcus budaensis]|uniref:Uncharacterized protein n=1 Tax=Deinococcus budaensis TaxID=1665626 RepID=A0A7W8LQ41_9DEIO|nr:hypothetical protein [Deinococcus budaensis]
MKLSDVQKRLAAPFPAHLVGWKPQALTKDRSRALLVAYIDARAVMDRLDATCPDLWEFRTREVTGTPTPIVQGSLTVLGVTREDYGEAGEGEAGTIKAAASDALKRCAVHFGIGRYLYDLPKCWADWDDKKREPVSTPELPEWARPEHERSPGGAHIVQAMEQLRYELPEDLDLQREVYRCLKAALNTVYPAARQPVAREPEAEGDLPTPPLDPISKATKSQIAAHLEGPRWGLERDERLAFTSWLADRRDAPLASSAELTETEGRRALNAIERCAKPKTLLGQWRADPAGLPGEAEALGAVG